MGQKKLIKFAAIKEYNNVLEFPQDMQGKWAAFFDALKKGTSSNTPLVLELACG